MLSGATLSLRRILRRNNCLTGRAVIIGLVIAPLVLRCRPYSTNRIIFRASCETAA